MGVLSSISGRGSPLMLWIPPVRGSRGWRGGVACVCVWPSRLCSVLCPDMGDSGDGHVVRLTLMWSLTPPPLCAAHPPLTPTHRLRRRVVGSIAQAGSEHLNPLLYLSLLSDYSFQLALPLLSTWFNCLIITSQGNYLKWSEFPNNFVLLSDDFSECMS